MEIAPQIHSAVSRPILMWSPQLRRAVPGAAGGHSPGGRERKSVSQRPVGFNEHNDYSSGE